jgi:iron(III) transport system ATP-binding protein
MPIVLECTDLSKAFNGQPVLDRVGLTARAGKLVALLGPSGCGKTTTLRLIAGFEWPDAGTITIKGRMVAGGQARIPPEERRVGMVFQEYALFPHVDVASNIAFGLTRLPSRERAARVAAMLALVGLETFGKRMPHELSGGQQQRVALARALAPQPDILLLDEPFSNLDAALRMQVRGEVRAILKDTGITCVFVTHDQEEALSLADEVAVMIGGRIAQIAEPERLYHQPVSRAVAAFVGEANFVPGEADGERAHCALGQMPLAQTFTGPVDILVLPEHLVLSAGEPNATITWREFYGHDQRVGLRLDDGTPLVARSDALSAYGVGDRVGVQVAAPMRAFRRTA